MTCTTVRRAAGSLGRPVCGDNEEADQCVEGAAPRARRVERVGGTSGGVMPLREHPSADQLRVRVRHAAILRHRDGHFHCDGRLHCDGGLERESGVSSGRVRPVGARARLLSSRAARAWRRAGGRWPPVCRWGGIGLLRHADGEAGGAPRPPLEQPLYSRFTAAPIMPYKSRYREGFARPDRPGRDGHQQPDGRSDEQSAR